MNYPTVNLEESEYTLITQNKTGVLLNCYTPLFNLNKQGLSEFTTINLKFNRNITEDLLITDEYDGSSNIVLNDDVNIPRLINTRVSLQENNTFLIPEHSGNSVTNVYEDDVLDTLIGLFKLYQTIPDIEFLGLTDGQFPCGSYHFYFKFADADGNMTNTAQHSGLVLLHIGLINTYKVRMGLEDENSGKGVSFKLTNCSAGFDYIRVFYERTSSGEDLSPITTYTMINQNFPIINGICLFTLTGAEENTQITLSDLLSEYADIASAKTLDIAQNILFLANTSAYVHDYKELQKIAWDIYPTTLETEVITDNNFDYSLNEAGSYYNVKNVYNYTGYWSDEFYRFGIVFVYNNNLLSPVFNVLGYNEDDFDPSSETINTEFEPDDYLFKKKGCVNSKGVFKIKKCDPWKGLQPNTLGIKFYYKSGNLQTTLQKHDIKGYFFVRQKRVPTILALGIVIGVTNKKLGGLPILQDGVLWVSKSFLSELRLLNTYGSDIYTDQATPKGLLIPDAELQPLSFNHIFTSLEFSLSRIGNVRFEKNGDWFQVTQINIPENSTEKLSKITAVNKDTIMVTDGENYFSTTAGNVAEAYKTVDIDNDWDETPAQDLTLSQTLVRGLFGYYAGLSIDDFSFGDIINIKKKEFSTDKDNQINLEFLSRFSDYTKYSPISPRYNLSSNGINLIQYGGDCFHSAFTHRMMNNFADTELPTNTKIVDPKSWAKNYAVRTTAYRIKSTSDLPFNCLESSNGGWLVDENEVKRSEDKDIPTYFNLIAEVFEVKQYSATNKDDDSDYKDMIIDAELLNQASTHLRLKAPEPVKTGLALVDSMITLVLASTEDWVPRGSGNINRSDINAVSFGQWITLPICSTMNLAFRDLAFSNVTEENTFNLKRSFFPLKEMNPKDHIQESDSINFGIKKTISTNTREAYKTKPFTKQEYFNRIYWSKPNVSQDFINSYRMIFSSLYREYSKEYGAITKIVSEGNYLVVVFEHGIGVLEVNRTPQNEQEYSQYLASKSVLPVDIQEITADYGSMWKDSIIKTPTGIVYGVDTVAKKIWQLTGSKLNFISDLKVNKFLNKFITLSEFDTNLYNGHLNVKTHYNEFKHDVIFTFIKDTPKYTIEIGTQDVLNEARIAELQKLFNIQTYDIKPWTSSGNNIFTAEIYDVKTGQKIQEDTYVVRSGRIYYNNLDTGLEAKIEWEPGTQWSLCYNELQQQFVTFYDWYPYFSENINNIFFTFDQEQVERVFENNKKKSDISVTINNNIGESFTTNKNSFDNAFTGLTTVEYWYPTTKNVWLSIIPQKSLAEGYLGFYLKGAELPDPPLTPLKVLDGFTFYVVPFSSTKINRAYTVALKVTGDEILIADISYKNWDINNDLGFKYFTLRNTSENVLYVWKHGQGGLYDNQGEIKPTNWYGKLHEFNFEFVVNDDALQQKVFNNLKMLSNKAEPNKFEFEVVGEGYEWFDYKPIVEWINSLPKQSDPDYWWKYVLNKTAKQIQSDGHPEFPNFKTLSKWDNSTDSRMITKLPYLKMKLTDKKGSPEVPSYDVDFWSNLNSKQNGSDKHSFNCNEVCLVEDEQLNEQRIRSEQLGNDVKKYGRLRGNMQYLEDLWDVEIRPIKFKWCYMDGKELKFESKETRNRDKYLKVKVRYSGEDLAIIQAIATMYDISYA